MNLKLNIKFHFYLRGVNMDFTDKEQILKFNNSFKKQLTNYMNTPPIKVNYTNSKLGNRKVRFNTNIGIRYYELDDEERIEKILIYNSIKLNILAEFN